MAKVKTGSVGAFCCLGEKHFNYKTVQLRNWREQMIIWCFILLGISIKSLQFGLWNIFYVQQNLRDAFYYFYFISIFFALQKIFKFFFHFCDWVFIIIFIPPTFPDLTWSKWRHIKRAAWGFALVLGLGICVRAVGRKEGDQNVI